LKNVVTRALGGGPSVSPDLQELSFETGDVFLFCSDGLTTMLSDEEIRDAAAEESEPKNLCDKLVEMANEKGGVDNITVVAARITEAHQEPTKAKEPTEPKEAKEPKETKELKDSKESSKASKKS
jgi:protein phosphatase